MQIIEINPEDLEGDAFEITEADLQAVERKAQFVTITLDDLRQFEQQEIVVNETDLPPIFTLDWDDLPPILELRLADLPSDLNEMTTECYHGTSWEAAEKICREGFKVGNGAAWGAGIYFSVGGVSIARSYVKSARPCLIRARVNWGRVAYLDDPKLRRRFRGRGNAPTRAALKAGYNSFLTTKQFSKKKPAIGIVLYEIGGFVKPPRLEVVELIDPKSLRNKK